MKLYDANNHNSAAAMMRAFKTRVNLKQNHFVLSAITHLIEKFVTTKAPHDITSSRRHSSKAEHTPQVMDTWSII